MTNGKTKFPRWLMLLGLGVGGFFALVIGLIVVAALAAGSSPSDAALKECQRQNSDLRARLSALESGRSAAPAAAPAPAQDDGSFGPGTMIVGKDVKPGRYRSAGAADGAMLCYYERLRGFSGEPGDLISNEVAQPQDGAVIVNIKATDAGFQSKGCGRWVPLE